MRADGERGRSVYITTSKVWHWNGGITGIPPLAARTVASQHQDQLHSTLSVEMDAAEAIISRDLSISMTEMGYNPNMEEMLFLPIIPQAIRTKGLFPMMDLPAEIRLKVILHTQFRASTPLKMQLQEFIIHESMAKSV